MIRMEKVAKVFRGVFRLPGREVRALDGVTLRVEPGSALGVIGPNGAGKSTLFRLLLGYLHPSEGELTLAGLAPRAYAERHGIGYVPERVAIPPGWTVRRALRAYAALGEVDDPERCIAAQMRRFALEEVAGRSVAALSKGSVQRLAVAQALLGARKLLILDEPTDGLDPYWMEQLRAVLLQWRREDPERVLLFASHNLEEVERIADRVLVLNEGRVQEEIDLAAAAVPLAYRLRVASPADEALARELFPDAAEGGAPASLRVTAPDLAELNRRIARFLERGGTLEALLPEGLAQRYRQSFRGKPRP